MYGSTVKWPSSIDSNSAGSDNINHINMGRLKNGIK